MQARFTGLKPHGSASSSSLRLVTGGNDCVSVIATVTAVMVNMTAVMSSVTAGILKMTAVTLTVTVVVLHLTAVT